MAIPKVENQQGVQDGAHVPLKQGALQGRKIAPVSNQEEAPGLILLGSILLVIGIILLSVGASKTPKNIGMIRIGSGLLTGGVTAIIVGSIKCCNQ